MTAAAPVFHDFLELVAALRARDLATAKAVLAASQHHDHLVELLLGFVMAVDADKPGTLAEVEAMTRRQLGEQPPA